jgi:glycosyltransferase involved in cell wall biosynthesis
MPYVRDALASLRRQTYRRFEVVVQDGGSSDGTAEFLSSLELDRVEFRSEPDGGIGDAYNRAFERCSGELVATLDADNLLPPEALSQAVRAWLRNPRVAALYGAVQVIDDPPHFRSGTIQPGRAYALRVGSPVLDGVLLAPFLRERTEIRPDAAYVRGF